MPVDPEKLMVDKRTVRGRLCFVVADEIVLVDFNDSEPLPTIPEDGGQWHVVKFADGTGDSGNGNGWLIFGRNSKGIVCQWTGDESEPTQDRYPGCQFCRAQVTDSATHHVSAELYKRAIEEAAQWR